MPTVDVQMASEDEIANRLYVFTGISESEGPSYYDVEETTPNHDYESINDPSDNYEDVYSDRKKVMSPWLNHEDDV